MFDFTVNQMVFMSEGTYPNGHRREGIVVRPMINVHSDFLGGNLSTKVINPLYLLETGE
jgi:hypothetical protein